MPAARGVDGRAGRRRIGHSGGILDPRVVDADDHVGHCLLHQVEVAEGEIALIELTIAHESLQHAVHVVPDTLCASIPQCSG